MALLPAGNLLDGSKVPATTTSEMKGALGALRSYLADLLGIDSTDKAAARTALGAAPVVSAVLTKSVAGNVDITLLPIEAINDILVFTGALTANIAVIVPNTSKSWIVRNKTTGNFTLTLKTAAGAGVSIAQGKKRALYCDGIDVNTSISDFSDVPIKSESYVFIRYAAGAGNAGGSYVAGTYRTRPLNAIASDDAGLAALAVNQITLKAGTYRFRATAPAFQLDQNKIRLYDLTHSIAYPGDSVMASSSVPGSCTATAVGRFTIAAPTVFELQHVGNSSNTNGTGFGLQVGSGDLEIYAQVEFWKEL